MIRMATISCGPWVFRSARTGSLSSSRLHRAWPLLALAASLCLALSAQQPATQPASSPDTTAPTGQPEAATIEQAQANLRAAEAQHPGNTSEVAEAMSKLLRLQVEAVPVTDELLAESRRAIAVAEGAEGKDSGLYAKALAGEAWVYYEMYRPELARPIAEDALAIAQRAGKPEAIAFAADALGNVCAGVNDNACYLQNTELAVASLRAVKDAAPIDLATYLTDLIESRRRKGDIAGASAALDEALALAAEADKQHSEVGQRWAAVENDAGSFRLLNYKCEVAIPHLRKAVDLLTQAYGADSPSLNTPLSNLAYSQICAGQTDESLKTYERARVTFLKMYGPNHSMMAFVETGYAEALEFKGRYQDAADLALDAHRTLRQGISLAIRLLPERQALAMSDQATQSFNTLVTLAALHPGIRIADVYQEVVRSRALVTEEMAQRAAALSRKPDPAVEALEKEMDTERRAVMEMQGSSSGSAQALSEATSKMERTERELAARSAHFRTGERARSSEIGDLRKNLPKESVLISYVKYTQYRLKRDKFQATRIPSYLAFVMHPGAETVAIHDLGAAKTIDDLVGRMRASAEAVAHAGGMGAARGEREYRVAGEQLRKLIWDPLAAEVKDAQLALIVPDGVLNLVPFSGLPEGNGYLVEHGLVVHMLTSERDLIPAEPAARKTGLIAVGSPAFELSSAVVPPSPLRDGPVNCDAFRKMEFNPLPGSLSEVREISTNWKRWNPGEREALLTGGDATRAKFLEAASQYRILHVATHAFVLDQSCGNGNPLLHSGLVFAGANTTHDASILTAQQIASLDLAGVDWAVLSACNTGNGELRDGEGVLGLERAFRVAGARSVVMTLWPVDDAVTREFMRKLYAERFGRGASTANAAWNAARKLLQERRAAGKSTHPWYWAGFVGAGDWR
jgi:CHAT domain-containing protein